MEFQVLRRPQCPASHRCFCYKNYVTLIMKSCTKDSRRNNFTFWRESRWTVLNRVSCQLHSLTASRSRPFGLRPAGPLALLLAPHNRPGYAWSLAPRQRAWGPAAECELIPAQTPSLSSNHASFSDPACIPPSLSQPSPVRRREAGRLCREFDLGRLSRAPLQKIFR